MLTTSPQLLNLRPLTRLVEEPIVTTVSFFVMLVLASQVDCPYTAVKRVASTPKMLGDAGGSKQNTYGKDTTTATSPPSHTASVPTPPPADGCTSSRGLLHQFILTTSPQLLILRPPIHLIKEPAATTVSCLIMLVVPEVDFPYTAAKRDTSIPNKPGADRTDRNKGPAAPIWGRASPSPATSTGPVPTPSRRRGQWTPHTFQSVKKWGIFQPAVDLFNGG